MGKISFLWPKGCEDSYFLLEQQTVKDLDLKSTVNMFSSRNPVRESLMNEIVKIPLDFDVISYRQSVFEDLLENPELEKVLREVQPYLDNLIRYSRVNKTKEHPVSAMLSKIGELDAYIKCVDQLDNALSPIPYLKSQPFNSLKKAISSAVNDTVYISLRSELPQLIKKIRGIRSMSIGINLDHQLKPVGATILSIDSQRYKGTTLLDSIFKSQNEFTGIAPIHKPEVPGVNPWTPKDEVDPTLIPLFNDLFNLLKKSSTAVIKGLKKFESINTKVLSGLQSDINIFLGGLKMLRDLADKDLPFCKPIVLPKEHKKCVVEGYFNVNLAAEKDVIPSNVGFHDNERVAVLTGPNGGGKTVFLQGVAISQILFQLGLYVPGTFAEMSPVDGIYSHYQIEERPDENKGRFGEEAFRLSKIFEKATQYSLILMNESFSSTNAGESLYIAEDILKVIQKMGGWTIFATHLHDLAENVDRYNIDNENKIISLVCTIERDDLDGDVKRKYKIIKGKPNGQSYARELAAKFGICYNQLNEKLESRGVLV